MEVLAKSCYLPLLLKVNVCTAAKGYLSVKCQHWSFSSARLLIKCLSRKKDIYNQPFLHAAPRHVMVHLITAYRQKPVVRATKKWISEAVDDLGLY